MLIKLALVSGKKDEFNFEYPRYPNTTKAIMIIFTETGYFIKYDMVFLIIF